MESSRDTRERVLRSASRLFALRGYHGVGVAEICQRARVKKGSFYHFFGSKRDLALQVIEEAGRRTRRGIRPALLPVGSLTDRVERLAEGMWEAQRATAGIEGRLFVGSLVGNLSAEVATDDERLRRRLHRVLEHWRREIAEGLRAPVEGRPVVYEADAAAYALLAHLEGSALLARAANDPKLFLWLARQGARLIESGRGDGPSDLADDRSTPGSRHPAESAKRED